MDLLPWLVTFLVCTLWSLELGIILGTAVNLALLLYATSQPKIQIQRVGGGGGGGGGAEYLLVTPDRSLVFSAMELFMSTVRKASAQHRQPLALPVVIDMTHVCMADFSTAYVRPPRFLAPCFRRRGRGLTVLGFPCRSGLQHAQ